MHPKQATHPFAIRWRGPAPLAAQAGLYAIVDPEFCDGRDPIEVAHAILQGGCAVLQLRAKRLRELDFETLAQQIAALCRIASVPFVVNDSAEIAQRVGADGLHLGQSDLPIEQARARLGPGVAIGLSTHDLEQALAAQRRGADLIGFGPVFPTRSKHNPDPVVGLAGLRAVCSAVVLPVVAIGGIDAGNAPEIAASGAMFGAAIGALCSAADPRSAARALQLGLTPSSNRSDSAAGSGSCC
jgi:thiamine-phosphate pyrophosphorylase